MAIKLNDLRDADNICELLSKQKLMEIVEQLQDGYEIDESSRSEWTERVENTMKIAKQTVEVKNYPFPKSSNVKYPLIPLGAIDFAARMYPEFIQNDRVVKTTAVGQDPTGENFLRSQRVAYHMSYQVLNEIPDWEQGLDKLLHVLAIVGTVFKKTYYDPLKRCIMSNLCLPDRICVNYNAESLKTARRITHLLNKSKNDIISRVRKGLYADIDLATILAVNKKESGAALGEYLQGFDQGQGLASIHQDKDAEILIHEQQCYLDLDDDGYLEPYIATWHAESMTVLKIVNAFENVETNKKGEVVDITAEEYYTDYHFLPSPDGGFYSLGLGTLLYPINETMNTLINQLIDAGTLANIQGGFIGKGLRMKGGKMSLAPGEWKMVDAAPGQALKENILPLPVKEPSNVLFELLGMLTKAGEDLIHTTEAMKGQGETQNVANSTLMAMIEQGMKVYNGIAKRLWRAEKSEFNKIAQINSKYLTQKEYSSIIGTNEFNVKDDYNLADLKILPIADPSMSSITQRLMKAQAIMGLPGIDHYQAGVMFLEALQLDAQTIARLLPKPDPKAPPTPEDQERLAHAELFRAQAQALPQTDQLKQAEMQLKVQEHLLTKQAAEVTAAEKVGKIKKMESDTTLHAAKLKLDQEKQMTRATHDGTKLGLEHLATTSNIQLQQQASALATTEVAHAIHHDRVGHMLENKKLELDRVKAEEPAKNDGE